MRIGIVGAGTVGRWYGGLWAGRGHDVAFSYVRDRERLAAFVATLGPSARAVEPEDLAADAEVVVFSPPFGQIDDAAARLGQVGDAVLIDTTNPFNPERTGLVDLDGDTSSRRVAALFPGARVVKTLHNLSVEQATAAHAGAPAALFVAGDDPEAKDVAARLVVDAGLIPFDTGALASAALSEAPGPLFMVPLGLSEIGAAARAAGVAD